MNNKTKIMLGLSVLTAGTLAAGATGTLAWFTTNKTAKATYNNIKAVSSTEKIRMEIGSVTESGKGSVSNYDPDTGNWKNEVQYVGSASMVSDISSSDGKTLVKPIWTAQPGGTGTNFNKIRNAAPTEYTKFWIGIRNDGTNAAKVFLNSETLISASADKENDKALAKWSRAAVIDCGTSETKPDSFKEGNTICVFENEDAETEKDKYVSNEVSDTAGKITLGTVDTNKHVIGSFPSIQEGTTELTNPKAYLGNFAQGDTKTHYYVVTVWLEGTESNNQDAAIDASINVTLGVSAVESK